MDFKGTGMSIGIDRFVFALNQINKSDPNSNGILVLVLDEKYLDEYYSIVNLLRNNNIQQQQQRLRTSLGRSGDTSGML